MLNKCKIQNIQKIKKTPYAVIKSCVLTHPSDIILIFDIVISHNGDEPLKDLTTDFACIRPTI